MKGIDEAVRQVREGQRFLVACHRRPDADAFGSAVGFSAVLQQLGKDVTLYVPDELSVTLHYLVGLVPHVRELPEGATFDACWVMDTAAKSLLPDGLPDRSVRGPLIVVDHHAAHDDVGDLKLRDTDACSTGEVIATLARKLGVWPLPRAAASPLYAAIVADTGGFRYPATKPCTLRLGAELLEAGADPWEAAYELFEGWEEARMKLLASILDTLELTECGRVAVLRVTRAMLAEVGANDDMVEGMVNYGRMLRGVEVAALLWEWPRTPGADGAVDDGYDTKISLRSRGSADISLIAVALGGGGHRNAAGAQCSEDLETVRVRVLREAVALLGPCARG
ncbi:MAG: DHH family phosphoesterase [Polyangiales bacterium]|nr:DHH family phosphoesterase [Sandaracinaceae bacterium]